MNKFFRILYLAPLSFLLTGCWTASIITIPSPSDVREIERFSSYVTTVKTPKPKVTTVTTFVATNYNTDPSFYLDLNAVAAAFAESRSTREFEQILNSSRYMINNLDLNRDGWVDYLRVIETRQGYYHAYLIQSCVGAGLFQDVATLVAERQANALYVEVIGDPYLYGYNYIVRPAFVKTPAMWDVYGRPTYAVWSSPYYYGNYPSYYTRPRPVYLNHYQAYVTTYLTNHHYCHRCDYPSQPHYSGYTQMTRTYVRNDYRDQHPENSFERRVTASATQAGKSVRNTAQLRTEVEKSATTTTRTSSASRVAATPGTTVNTRVNRNGTTRTTVKTTDSTGRTTTVKRESGSSTRSSGTSTRTSGSSTRSSSTTRTSSTGGSVRSSRGTTTESNPRSSRRAR